ncbi:MAG: hypothetical protein R3297_02375 [Desulfobulbales bacterium]|nr:hypothetical protein [Desulfobulbales bacterium]
MPAMIIAAAAFGAGRGPRLAWFPLVFEAGGKCCAIEADGKTR